MVEFSVPKIMIALCLMNERSGTKPGHELPEPPMTSAVKLACGNPGKPIGKVTRPIETCAFALIPENFALLLLHVTSLSSPRGFRILERISMRVSVPIKPPLAPGSTNKPVFGCPPTVVKIWCGSFPLVRF